MSRARKLTNKQVQEIRKITRNPCEHCGSKASQAYLARKYSVSRVTIHFIFTGARGYDKRGID